MLRARARTTSMAVAQMLLSGVTFYFLDRVAGTESYSNCSHPHVWKSARPKILLMYSRMLLTIDVLGLSDICYTGNASQTTQTGFSVQMTGMVSFVSHDQYHQYDGRCSMWNYFPNRHRRVKYDQNWLACSIFSIIIPDKEISGIILALYISPRWIQKYTHWQQSDSEFSAHGCKVRCCLC